MRLWNVRIESGVVVATYDNPPMNYFCAEGVGELLELIEQWRDPGIRAVVLAGRRPGMFITHYSVEELERYASDPDALRASGTVLNDGYHAMLMSLRNLPKPVVAAMNGDAMGGGFELCLACDIRIAQRGDYRFGLPEVKLGILPGGSGTQRLSRLIGAGRAIEFILRGRIVTPDEAMSLTLVHELVDDALTRAHAVATELACLPPVALREVKRAVYDGIEERLPEGLKIEGARFLETMLTEDARTAMRAYIALPYDRRRPYLEAAPSLPYTGT